MQSLIAINKILKIRIQLFEEIASTNGMTGPVAGNFLRAPYSFSTTDRFLCVFSRCTGEAFPAPLPGVNDAPECQP